MKLCSQVEFKLNQIGYQILKTLIILLISVTTSNLAFSNDKPNTLDKILVIVNNDQFGNFWTNFGPNLPLGPTLK